MEKNKYFEKANKVLKEIPSINKVLVFSYNKKEKLNKNNFKILMKF